MRRGRGLFITVEGIEGSGKTTVCRLIAERLLEDGVEIETTFDPGGNEVSQRIREIALGTKEPVCGCAELLLFAAARAQNVHAVIAPALQRGAVALSDRFSDSSMAYQGYGRSLPLVEVSMIDKFARAGLVPDITLLLDLPVEIGLARQMVRDRISSEGAEFHERVRQGFLEIAKNEPDRIKIIDARADADSVLDLCLSVIREKLTTMGGEKLR